MNDTETSEDDQNIDFLIADESAATGESMFRLLQGKLIEMVNDILPAANDPNYGEKMFFHRWTRWYR